MDYWKRVKTLIKSKNLTQEKICKTCGISLATFVSWIHNERLPDLLSAVKIASVLNTSVEFLVTGKEPDKAAEELEQLKAKLYELSQC